MPTVFITGASRGLGLEFTRQYADAGWRVLASCRDPGSAPELTGIAGDVTVYLLDVADFGAIDGLATDLAGTAIDVLLNNAGAMGPPRAGFGGTDYDAWEEVLRVNVLAPMKVCEAFAGHVEASDQKRIAALSSRLGSMTHNRDGGFYIYRSSKAGLNAVVKSLSVDLSDRGIAVAAFHPGWARTRMGGPRAPVLPEESVAGIRRLIAGLTLADSGAFFNYDGVRLDW